MKKFILIILVLATGMSSCSKSDSFDAGAQAATDDTAIQAYIKTNNITATKDASGLYYQVITQGTGANATANSNVTVNYSGKYLDGTAFTTGSLSKTPLYTLIPGWIIGIPYVKAGGRIVLYIPSGLGYGHSPTNGIRADAVLIFTIDVLGV